MSIQTAIEAPYAVNFRKAYVKRRQTSDGKYESDWLEVTDFVKSWGTMQTTIDDVRLNRFTHSGVNLICRNDTGFFNPETNVVSGWSGYLTRYKTLIKIEAGYTYGGTDLPTNACQGVFIMTKEIPISAESNEATLQATSLMNMFDEVRADEVSGLGATQTASDAFEKIRDHTDGSGNFIFREVITSTSWSIQTTTTNYNLATTTSILNLSCWELMEKLAEAEGYVVYITRDGGVDFKDREPNTTSSQFTFNGQGYQDMNVIAMTGYKEAYDKLFNYIEFQFEKADTSTSYVYAGTTTTIDPSNASWKYGQKKYQLSNEFFSTDTAQVVANNLYDEHSVIKDEITIVARFVPHIDILDRVTLNYSSYDLAGQELWDAQDWASDTAISVDDGGNWAVEQGENFDWYQEPFKVISRTTNLDNMTTMFTLRAI